MRLFLLSSVSVLLTQLAGAQSQRWYLFAGPVPNNGATTSPASFGILPQPVTPGTTPAGTNNAYAAGLGLEHYFGNYIGAGLDLAGLMPSTGKVIDNTLGAISPNLYVHWPQSNRPYQKWDLYATGGYSALFRDFGANGVNGGGGLNYWFDEPHANRGLMLEFRYLRVLGSNPPTPATSYYQVRIGLTFR